MINEVFQVLRDALIDHIRLRSGFRPTESTQEPVVFFSGDKVDTIDFKLGAVTMLLVNIEEDRTARPADPYRRTLPDGTTMIVKAPVPLNLYVLFVARHSDYLESLRSVALVVQFFQKHRVMDRASMPALSARIERLVAELVTIPVTEQNHVWSLLQTAYQPSLLYKIRMAVFEDEDGLPAAAAPGEATTKVNA